MDTIRLLDFWRPRQQRLPQTNPISQKARVTIAGRGKFHKFLILSVAMSIPKVTCFPWMKFLHFTAAPGGVLESMHLPIIALKESLGLLTLLFYFGQSH